MLMSAPVVLITVMSMPYVPTLMGAILVHVNLVTLEMDLPVMVNLISELILVHTIATD